MPHKAKKAFLSYIKSKISTYCSSQMAVRSGKFSESIFPHPAPSPNQVKKLRLKGFLLGEGCPVKLAPAVSPTMHPEVTFTCHRKTDCEFDPPSLLICF